MNDGTAPAAVKGSSAPLKRLTAVDWSAVERELDAHGCATIAGLLTADECAAITASWDAADRYRRHIVMQRHGYGRGEYKYFAYPLPGLVQELRSAAYPHLAPIANRWVTALGTGSGCRSR